MLTLDFDLKKYPMKEFTMPRALTVCDTCGECLDMGDMVLKVDGYDYGYHHPACLGITEICDCCGDWLTGAVVKARYTLPGIVYDYKYCSEACKHEHHLRLIRNHGL